LTCAVALLGLAVARRVPSRTIARPDRAATSEPPRGP
jgi:hypothetical protein